MGSVGLYVVALFTIVITYWVYRWTNPKCKGKLPPGSMGLPLIGESIQFFVRGKSLDIQPFVKKRLERYGPLFKTSLAGRPVIVSSDAEFNHFIFTQEGKLVEFWYLDSFTKLLGHGGSLTAIGKIHRYIRNATLKHFGHEALKEKLLPEVDEMARQCLRLCSSRESVEVKKSVSTMIFGLTSKQLFSLDPTQYSEDLSEMFTNFMQGLMSLPLNIPGTTFYKCMKNQKKALKIIKDMLDERRASPEKIHGDFLDHVIEDMKKESFLTEEFVVFLMFGLMVATFETIATALTLSIMLLTDHPWVVKELTEENEAVLKNRENMDSAMTWDEYKSMAFTSHVVNETLRLANATPGHLRRAIKDIEVDGYTIPVGWTIMVAPATQHLNPKIFEDPLAFNPWRWKELKPNTTAKAFIPFGGGMRPCAGAEFSRLVMAVFLHNLVTKYRWTKIKGGDLVRAPGLIFKNGYHINVSEKSKVKAVLPQEID